MTHCASLQRRRLTRALAALSVIVGVSAACYAQAPNATGSDMPAYSPGQALDASKDPVVAIVDGRYLHLSELGDLAGELSPGDRQNSFASIYPALLDGLIDHTALELKARRLHLDEKPDVKRRIAEAVGRTLERALLEDVVSEKVTEDAIQSAYAQKFGGRATIETAHLWIILTATEDAAQQALAQLRSGVDFSTVARAFSKDPSAAAGGDVGFMRQDQLQPAIAAAAFAVQPDQVAPKPVLGRFGWYIIRVQQRGTAAPPSYEAAHDELRQQLKEQAITQAIQQARSEASVQEFNMDGSALTDKTRELLPYLPVIPDDQ